MVLNRLWQRANEIKRIINPVTCSNRIFYVSEGSNWVIKRIGDYLRDLLKIKVEVIYSPKYIRNAVLHFGSLSSYLKFRDFPELEKNKLIITVFHGDILFDSIWQNKLQQIIDDQDKFSKIIVANSIMLNRFTKWGIDRSRLAFIPIGIDVSRFWPMSENEKRLVRARLGIPAGVVCVGSFQKDGNGWGQGLEPKRVKGPDLFVKAVALLAKEFPIHVLLTGPSRGYIKQELSRAGISFTHVKVNNYAELVKYYNALDLYLISSREEGGPKAIMECLASGTPLVTTKVGMAPDIICNNDCAIMVKVEDVLSMVEAMSVLLKNEQQRDKMKQVGLKKVCKYDWKTLGKQYERVYKEVSGRWFEGIKIALGYEIRRGPWGGGNRFLDSFKKHFTKLGAKIVQKLEADLDFIIIVNPLTGTINLDELKIYKQQNPEVKVIHRINETDIAKNTNAILQQRLKASEVSDCVVFLSKWLKDHYIGKGFNPDSVPNVVIKNGVDRSIFNSHGYKRWKKGEPLKLVTHHWSSNEMKGMSVYRQLDALLADPAMNKQFEFTYIGNLPQGTILKNSKKFPPLSGKQLAAKIREHHVYLTAARYEACAMHPMEGAACGLPVLFSDKGGGLVECCRDFGIQYSEDQFEKGLFEMRQAYDKLVNKMQDFSLTSEDFNNLYELLFLQMMKQSYEKGELGL